MLIINCIAIVLGIVSTTLMVIMCIRTSMPYLKYFLAVMVSLLCFFVSDFVVSKVLGIMVEDLEDRPLAFAWIPDFFFVLFMFFWILLVASLNEIKPLIPVKYLICVCAAYYVGVEVLIRNVNVIIGFNMVFDLFLALNGVYFLVYGIRNKYSFVNRYLTPFLGLCMLIYCLITAYTDYSIAIQIKNNIFPEFPEDTIIIPGVAVEIITIIYFFYIDPLSLRRKEPENIDISALQDRFNLTDRETEIAAFLFEGLTNSEIAERAFVSENTVKRHLTNIYKKTGASNRYELLVKLMKER